MTKQNTSGELFNRLLKGLWIVSAICISSLSFAVDTDHDGLPDDWETANGRNPLMADYMVIAGYYHNCALDDTGVVCWGKNDDGQTTVPTLTDPTQVSAAFFNTCVLDDTGVTCWGNNMDGQTTIPTLANPTQVSAGYRHICALHDMGVVCWGNNDVSQTTVPTLANPSQVSAGAVHSCALDDMGVVCWGNNDLSQTTVPTLTNPTQISVGFAHTCALDDTGVTCWGNNEHGQRDVSSLVIDPDGDGFSNQDGIDPFPLDATEWLDTDNDGIGDNSDNCISISNVNQLNSDLDATGNVCDTDDDGDGYSDSDELAEGTDPLDANSAPRGGLNLMLIKAAIDKKMNQN